MFRKNSFSWVVRVFAVGSGSKVNVETWDVKALNAVKKGAHVFSDATSDLFGHTKYLYIFALFIQSIVNAVSYLKKPLEIVSSSYGQKFITINTHFITYVDGVLILVDLKEILAPDDKGRWLWQRHGQFIGEKLCWTATHAFDHVDFLNYLEAINLSSTALSVVGLGSAVFKVGACVFGIWEKARSIQHQEKKRFKACKLKDGWAKRAQNWPTRSRDTLIKIKHFEAKIARLDSKSSKMKEAVGNLNKWRAIQQCNDSAKIKSFCKASSERNLKKISKCNSKHIRSAASIAFYVSLIALVALGLTFHFTKIGNMVPAKVTMILFSVGFTSIEIGNLIIYKFISIKKVPKLKADKMLGIAAAAG